MKDKGVANIEKLELKYWREWAYLRSLSLSLLHFFCSFGLPYKKRLENFSYLRNDGIDEGNSPREASLNREETSEEK